VTSVAGGVQERDIEAAAAAVPIRPFALGTLAEAMRRGWPVHIISVHWSSRFISAALADLLSVIARDGEDLPIAVADGDAPAIIIHANMLDMQLGMTTGAAGPVRQSLLLAVPASPKAV
jgi:hypothetical protein